MSISELNLLSAKTFAPETAPQPADPPVPVSGLRALPFSEMGCAAAAEVNWLWNGYLAPGQVTLLTSIWKSGKTTLLSVLLARLHDGRDLAGRRVRPGRAIVVSEEDPSLWLGRGRRLDFGPRAAWLCRPFAGRPRPEQWGALIDYLAAERRERGLDLAVIDPLASFLPGRGENDAGVMLDALLPLQRLTTLGVAVLVLHHPRKGDPAPGQAARGSGALSGSVDVVVEMSYEGLPTSDDRRRRLLAFSRHPATPRRLVIELSADGTDYAAHGDFGEQDDARGWELVRMVLEDASDKLTRRQILEGWPTDYTRPDKAVLARWMERARADGGVLREGTGKKNDPYRWWLPGQEELWELDPFRLPPLEESDMMLTGLEIARRELAKRRALRGK